MGWLSKLFNLETETKTKTTPTPSTPEGGQPSN